MVRGIVGATPETLAALDAGCCTPSVIGLAETPRSDGMGNLTPTVVGEARIPPPKRRAPAARVFERSTAARAGSFLLRRQKKRTKEKATRALRPSGVPSVGREPKVSLHSFGACVTGGKAVECTAKLGKKHRAKEGADFHPAYFHLRVKVSQHFAHVSPSLQGEGPGVRMVCPSSAAAASIVRREGTPQGRVCGAAFSLVRFFWPRKRNEPARTAAEGVNQPAPQALTGVNAVTVAVAVENATATQLPLQEQA